jgi:hypothetical protein
MFFFLHLFYVHNEIFQVKGRLFAKESDLACFKYQEVIVIFNLLNHFIRMAHSHFNFLSQIIESFTYKGFEKLDIFKYFLIRLL